MLQIMSCFFLTGLIWVIQIIHYPSYHYVHTDNFQKFQEFHTQKITYIVAPMMLLELFTGLALAWFFPEPIYFLNAFSIALVWLSTFFLSVPLHSKLMKQYDQMLITKLIISNWPRTIVWSLRSLFWMAILLSKTHF